MLCWSHHRTDIRVVLSGPGVGQTLNCFTRKYFIARRVKESEGRLSGLVEEVGNVKNDQRELELSVGKGRRDTNQSLETMKEQLGGLVLNKYCQNRWNYSLGRCYYFSLPSETDTWDGAQVVGPYEGI